MQKLKSLWKKKLDALDARKKKDEGVVVPEDVIDSVLITGFAGAQPQCTSVMLTECDALTQVLARAHSRDNSGASSLWTSS